MTKTKNVLFLHNYFPNQRLHFVERHEKVITEGGVANFFDNTEEESTAVPVEKEEEGADTLLVTPELLDNTNKNVEILRKEGYGVDNNNNSAPEKSLHLLKSMTRLRIMSGDLDQIYVINNQRVTPTIFQRY